MVAATDNIVSNRTGVLPETRIDDSDGDPAIIVRNALHDSLDKRDVYALLGGEVDAIRVKQVASPQQCGQLCKNAVAHKDRQQHAAVKLLEILGTPHYLAVDNPRVEQRYYDKAQSFTPAIREMSVPLGSPMDAAIAVLNDAWPAGVIPGRLDTERPMPPCIFRIYPPGSPGVEPHIDDLRQEVPHSQVANALIGQFGFNLYLAMPARGGELIIHDRKPSIAEFQAKAIGYSWPKEAAGPPKHVIMPEVGEMILINTRQLHAVGACFEAGCRATLSGFGGVINERRPMMIWA